jgi:hypothetical protein
MKDEAESTKNTAMKAQMDATDIVDREKAHTAEQNGLKIHPQPTSDPLDPLNWSRLQKHTILGIVMLK